MMSYSLPAGEAGDKIIRLTQPKKKKKNTKRIYTSVKTQWLFLTSKIITYYLSTVNGFDSTNLLSVQINRFSVVSAVNFN